MLYYTLNSNYEHNENSINIQQDTGNSDNEKLRVPYRSSIIFTKNFDVLSLFSLKILIYELIQKKRNHIKKLSVWNF